MPTNGLKWGDSPAASSTASARTPAVARALEDEERGRRVEAVRRAIEAGVYCIDSLEVADRLLECGALESDEF